MGKRPAATSAKTAAGPVTRCATVAARLSARGFFEDTANFSGVTLPTLLAAAGVQPDADTLVIRGADGCSADVSLESARSQDNLVAYEWEGQPLPILHGFPARALFTHLPGSASVKWLLEIEVTTTP